MQEETIQETVQTDAPQNEAHEPVVSAEGGFTLKYRIPYEDFRAFHGVMSAEGLVQAKKRTFRMGLLQLAVGIAFLGGMLAGVIPKGGFSWVIVVLFILLGIYGLCYYRHIYPIQVRKNLQKQYATTPYLQSEIVVDVYSDHFMEHAADRSAQTLWEDIYEVRCHERLRMVMLDRKRCLFVPLDAVTKHADKFDRFLTEMCERYEKRRIDV